MAKHHTAPWILVAGSLLSLVLPWALTRSLGLVDFTNTGPIGDTIGGIAGPIPNFTGLIVLYYSLTEQFAANRLQERSLIDGQSRRDNERNFALSLELTDRTVAVYTKALNDYDTLGRNQQYFDYGPKSKGRPFAIKVGVIHPYFSTTSPLFAMLLTQIEKASLFVEQEAAIAAILAASLAPLIRDMKDIFDQLDKDTSPVDLQIAQLTMLLQKHGIEL